MITNDASYDAAMQKSTVTVVAGGEKQTPSSKISGNVKTNKEFDAYVKFEVILYCLKKESMLIKVDEIIHSISALYKDNDSLKKHPVREFYYSCDEGLLLLPQNTLPQFVSEAYKAGVLCFYLPG